MTEVSPRLFPNQQLPVFDVLREFISTHRSVGKTSTKSCKHCEHPRMTGRGQIERFRFERILGGENETLLYSNV